MKAVIRRLHQQDLPLLKMFLSQAGLGTEGISEETIEYFLLLEDENKTWKGTLGIEAFQNHGLLRSLVISSGQPENDIFLLFEQALALAKEKRMKNLFLATNKSMAVPFFKILGFQLIEKAELPQELLASTHIKTLFNVDNSLFFQLVL